VHGRTGDVELSSSATGLPVETTGLSDASGSLTISASATQLVVARAQLETSCASLAVTGIVLSLSPSNVPVTLGILVVRDKKRLRVYLR
jgi:hypothetical protein